MAVLTICINSAYSLKPKFDVGAHAVLGRSMFYSEGHQLAQTSWINSATTDNA